MNKWQVVIVVVSVLVLSALIGKGILMWADLMARSMVALFGVFNG